MVALSRSVTICEIYWCQIKHHPLPLTFNQTHSWSRRYVLRQETGTMIHQSHAAWHSRTWIYADGWMRSRRRTSGNSLRTRRVNRGRRSWCRSYRPRCVCFIPVCALALVFRVTQIMTNSSCYFRCCSTKRGVGIWSRCCRRSPQSWRNPNQV